MGARLSTVEDVLAMLPPRSGAVKRGGSEPPEPKVILKDIELDLDAKSATAIVTVSGWYFDASGRTNKLERDFRLSQETAQRLAREGGDHRLAFSVAASTMKQQLAKELKAKQDIFDNWCRDGAPTREETKAMKPLRFKPPAP